MKDKGVKLEEAEVLQKLLTHQVDLSNTVKYINLTGLPIGVVELRGPMHLRVCLSEERSHRKRHRGVPFSPPFFSPLKAGYPRQP